MRTGSHTTPLEDSLHRRRGSGTRPSVVCCKERRTEQTAGRTVRRCRTDQTEARRRIAQAVARRRIATAEELRIAMAEERRIAMREELRSRSR